MSKYVNAADAAEKIAEKHGIRIADLCDTFGDIPAADVAPVRRGNWEEWWPGIAEIMTGEEMLYRCSACDAKYADIDGYKYCPYCGAKMDKEVADETERTN